MDEPEPYIEWVPDDLETKSEEDLMGYALKRIEAQWHENGWDQPFTVGVIFQSDIPELDTTTMSVCVAILPPIIVEEPEEYFLAFAKLVAQAVYGMDYRDDDFQRILMLAALGHPDQDLEAPRAWMAQVLERGGIPIGWFAITEGFDGDLPEGAAELSNDEVRALPGVEEVRVLTYLSKNRYQIHVRRVRGQDEVTVTHHNKVMDLMGFALGLLVSASLRMKVMMLREASED